jgi:hypothetical protein
VRAIHARDEIVGPPKWRGVALLGLALVITGIAWMCISGFGPAIFDSRDDREGWLAAGMGLAMMGVFLWLIAKLVASSARKRMIKSRNACIILSPAGLAMVQGSLKGMLRWDEVTGVRRVGGNMPMQILVAGGLIAVNDVYTMSLDEIALHIRRNLG